MMRAFASPLLRISKQRSFHSTPAALEKLNIEGLASKVDLSGQNVLMRVDLNVPLDKSDEVTVTDDTRLRAIVPSAKVSIPNRKSIRFSPPPPPPLTPSPPPSLSVPFGQEREAHSVLALWPAQG